MHLINQLQIAAVPDVLRGAVMVLFSVTSLLVILVVLAQEGKGGGLAGAFGGAGAETFGVKAGTVNKFTSWLAAAFLGLALLYAGLSSLTKEPAAAPSTAPYSADDETEEGDATPEASDPNKKAEDDSDEGTKDGDKKSAPKKDGGGKGTGGGNGQGKGNGDGKGNGNDKGNGDEPEKK